MFCWTNTSLVEPRSAASRIVGVLRSSEPFDDATVEGRSEEHTSELQSRSDLVCRLLLEKKKSDIGFNGYQFRGRSHCERTHNPDPRPTDDSFGFSEQRFSLNAEAQRSFLCLLLRCFSA